MVLTHSDEFLVFVTFFRNYSAQLTTNELEAWLAELEASVEIPDLDDIPASVYVVGKNNPQPNTVIWAMNKEVFKNENGNLVSVKDPESRIVLKARKVSV